MALPDPTASFRSDSSESGRPSPALWKADSKDSMMVARLASRTVLAAKGDGGGGDRGAGVLAGWVFKSERLVNTQDLAVVPAIGRNDFPRRRTAVRNNIVDFRIVVPAKAGIQFVAKFVGFYRRKPSP
jgi:hypothetical protein